MASRGPGLVFMSAPPWEQWWFWALLAVAAVGLAWLVFLLRQARDRARRDVQHVGIALIWPGGPGCVPFQRWTRGFTEARLFEVGRADATTPVLRETTQTGRGDLELCRDPADRALILAVRRASGPPGQDGQDGPVKAELDTPFAPPAGLGANGCRLVLTELPKRPGRDGSHPVYEIPRPAGRSAQRGWV